MHVTVLKRMVQKEVASSAAHGLQIALVVTSPVCFEFLMSVSIWPASVGVDLKTSKAALMRHAPFLRYPGKVCATLAEKRRHAV